VLGHADQGMMCVRFCSALSRMSGEAACSASAPASDVPHMSLSCLAKPGPFSTSAGSIMAVLEWTSTSPNAVSAALIGATNDVCCERYKPARHHATPEPPAY